MDSRNTGIRVLDNLRVYFGEGRLLAHAKPTLTLMQFPFLSLRTFMCCQMLGVLDLRGQAIYAAKSDNSS
jgi:hypothetical protein